MGNLSNPYGSLIYLLAVIGVCGILIFSLAIAAFFNFRSIAQAGLNVLRWSGWYINTGFTWGESYWRIVNNQIETGVKQNETVKGNQTT